jgi:hypothetical protein
MQDLQVEWFTVAGLQPVGTRYAVVAISSTSTHLLQHRPGGLLEMMRVMQSSL